MVTLTRGRKGFDGGIEAGEASRCRQVNVKNGKLKINDNNNYALAA
jgi:hypothetical protein